MLDYRRLGKQRVETLQILKANLGLTRGWVNHPAAKMWKGYEFALAEYGLVVCSEWVSRGYRDGVREQILALMKEFSLRDLPLNPAWLGEDTLHDSHKSNLLRKDPVFYGQYSWDVPPDLPYTWPVQ